MVTKTERTVEDMRDEEVASATRHTVSLMVQAERLTHRLNVHLDEVEYLIEERKSRERDE